MSASFSEGVRVIIEHLVNGPDEQRRNALVELAALVDADKRDAADYLCECLPKEQDRSLRGWYLSASAAMKVPEDASIAIAYLDPNKERAESVRGWAAIAVARVKPHEYEKCLEKAERDPSSQVRAIALRLLIENGIDEGENADRLLKNLRAPKDVGDRLAVLKALRASAGNAPLPQSFEKKLLPILRSHLLTNEGVETEQRQAALVLGDFKHEWADGIDVLYRALELHHSAWVRRACVKALTHTERADAKKALAFAIADKDREVSIAAINGLREVLGTTESVQFLIEEYVLRDDYPASEYLEALRSIDRTAAAEVLFNNVEGGDSKSASRALQALALLGIDSVTRVFHSQRKKVIEGYTQTLNEIDDQVVEQITKLTRQAERASNTSIVMYIVFFVVGLFVLGAGLLTLRDLVMTFMSRATTSSVASTGTSYTAETLSIAISIGVAIAGLLTLVLLFYRNPLDRIRRSAAGFVQVNVAFLGYIRQIHQIDLVFKQMFITETKPDSDQVRKTVEEIRNAVEHTVEEVRSYLVPD